MIIKQLEICGFRGFRDLIRIDFGASFTVIDGRNGVGKSSVFDAIEFALTGQISKYLGAKAAGESIDNYVWWTGPGSPESGYYVELTFTDLESEYVVRRTKEGISDISSFQLLEQALCNTIAAPKDPLVQLSSSSIIRDEHIASLSLDINESDRYTLIHSALGVVDADRYVEKALSLHNLAKKQSKHAENVVNIAIKDVSESLGQLDKVNASITDQDVLQKAVVFLQSYTNSKTTGLALADEVRLKIATDNAQLESLVQTLEEFKQLPRREREVEILEAVAVGQRQELMDCIERQEEFSKLQESNLSSSDFSETAKSIIQLIEMGQTIGLHDSHCPLCNSENTDETFEAGIGAALQRAKELDSSASAQAELEAKKERALSDVKNAKELLDATEAQLDQEKKEISLFTGSIRHFTGLDAPSADQISNLTSELQGSITEANQGLRILDTIKFDRELERATLASEKANEELNSAQKVYSSALNVEASAKSIYDAARRTRGESVDLRLERVLPLLSEFYKRLHPHPFWDEISHSVRGDVRKFLKLQVGEGLNPQFMFSSGQRRATGLAFLLAVNLSISWSRWKSILLDDPVQHIDDFRSVHLAEVLSQLVRSGKQVVCSVEDPALAEMLCRRLPVTGKEDSYKISLHLDDNGMPAVDKGTVLTPFVSSAFRAIQGQSKAQ